MMKENLSALMDGELSVSKTAATMQQLSCDDELRRSWDYYHLIRDSLHELSGPGFRARLRVQLDTEPTILEPRRGISAVKWRAFAQPTAPRGALVAVVAFVAGLAFPSLQQKPPTITATPSSEIKDAAILTADGINDYLFAHQFYSPHNLIPGVAFYKHAP